MCGRDEDEAVGHLQGFGTDRGFEAAGVVSGNRLWSTAVPDDAAGLCRLER